MKVRAKKLVIVAVVMAMMLSLVGCGGGEDTKETITKTVQEVSAAVKEPMQNMAFGLLSLLGVSDTTEIQNTLDPVLQSMDDAVAAIDKVEAPGADSQKYKDLMKDFVSLMKDMFTDLSKMDENSTMEDIQAKYNDQANDLKSQADALLKECSDKYGVDLSQYMTDNLSSESGETTEQTESIGETETTDESTDFSEEEPAEETAE